MACKPQSAAVCNISWDLSHQEHSQRHSCEVYSHLRGQFKVSKASEAGGTLDVAGMWQLRVIRTSRQCPPAPLRSHWSLWGRCFPIACWKWALPLLFSNILEEVVFLEYSGLIWLSFRINIHILISTVNFWASGGKWRRSSHFLRSRLCLPSSSDERRKKMKHWDNCERKDDAIFGNSPHVVQSELQHLTFFLPSWCLLGRKVKKGLFTSKESVF